MKAPSIFLATLALTATVHAAPLADPPPSVDPAAAGSAAGSAAADADGEPLPADAPKEPYELAAWRYGAMDQYLYVYSQILPELRDIDKRFGSSVKDEKEPYAADMAAARDELQILKGAVESAEKASIKVIAPEGALAVGQGRDIWGPAEMHTRRELARAWLSWALPDPCGDLNARELTAKSDLLGRALKYNGPSATDAPAKTLAIPAEDAAKPDAPIPGAPPPAADAPTVTAPQPKG